ncbi:MAG: hypothetical protein KAW02_06060 [candidate division Zixibacteria bacterium]|nr:hypothetical protein [candidate division Zixibacteria bacterium]
MPLSKHDKIAEMLAKKEKTTYNKGKGPDILGRNRIIEVATHESDVHSSVQQLRGYRKPKYISTLSELVEKAEEVTKGTHIGVMGPTGRIRKRAR